jgi:hypothetical protein
MTKPRWIKPEPLPKLLRIGRDRIHCPFCNEIRWFGYGPCGCCFKAMKNEDVDALRALPKTIEEVAAAEGTMEESRVVLPERLSARAILAEIARRKMMEENE